MPKKPSPPRAAKPRTGRPVPPPAADGDGEADDRVPFPIVAIGASAGGIEAVSELLRALPQRTGMAFVVLQHTTPDHAERLNAVLSRASTLPVVTVADGMALEPERVYVAGAHIRTTYDDGRFHVEPLADGRALDGAIDVFMRSLAQRHGARSLAVVLSGSATDGTRGLQEVKAAGGITFAQDASAEQDSMPRSAVATGVVDFVMSPGDIARELGRIAHHPYVEEIVSGGEPEEEGFAAVLQVLRNAQGVDFSRYKKNTIHRRITRRMLLHKLQTVGEYAGLLRSSIGEVEALYQDILIGVTCFFRDPDAFQALKATVFPAIVQGRSRSEPVRIWVAGCSTGEEAYSIAMAFTEFMEESDHRPALQVFATDLNGLSIERARAAVYPRSIEQDVTPERLRRFFVEVEGSYRVIKQVRDCCIFARQDVLQDPPFSHIDMVACRNLLIYLSSPLQQRLIPLLHYALRDHGYLWLGHSETIGAYRDLFELIDQKEKVYAKKPGRPRAAWEPTAAQFIPARTSALPLIATPQMPPAWDPQKEADRVVLGRYAPPGVLVDADLNIVQFRGDTSPFLAPAPGKASLGLMKMLREGLGPGVRDAVERARNDGAPVRDDSLRVRSDGGWRPVSAVAMPLKGQGEQVWTLVVFEEPSAGVTAKAREEARAEMRQELERSSDGNEREIARLRQELAATREYLQSVIEQQEAANEELQSANEEVQSANEELQSINEELETSKEEIQSSNEELATVNDELQARNFELSHSNNDLTNLLASVQMPIVMLGPDLRVRRFTPAAEKLLSLVPADIGRPITEIKVDVGGGDIEQMALDVIETISTRETEVQDRRGRWYSLRVRPYRTLDNKIEGVVVMFVDVDTIKRAEQAVRESEARFELLADSAPVMIWLSDASGLRFVNRAYEEFVGAPEAEIRAARWTAYIHPEDRGGYLASYEEALRTGHPFFARARFRRADGEYRWMKSVATARIGANNEFVGYVGCTYEITDVKEAEVALVELERGKNEFLAMLAHELRNPLAAVRNASLLLKRVKSDPVIEHAREIVDRQTEHMVRMVDDLLEVTRITHGKIRIEPRPVNFGDVVTRALEDAEPQFRANAIAVRVDLAPEPLVVSGDAIRLAQIVANLLHNAGKFTPAGGEVRVSLEREPPRGLADNGFALLRVRDNGCGIDSTVLPRIFDLFVQENRPNRAGGIGLGLTLARRLVELHGGTIEAQSAGPGMGSEFTVRLPLLDAASLVTPVRAPADKVTPRRVLIVDDNRDSAWSLRLMLRMDGHEVEVIHEGATAIETAKRMHADVVLLDIGLPDVDGYSVARGLRDDPETRDVFIIATTGYGRAQDREKSRRAGIDRHMTKPVDMDELMTYVNRGRRNAADETAR